MYNLKNEEELKLAEAKNKFISSMIALSPTSIIKDKPLSSVGMAVGTGVAFAITGLRMGKIMIGGLATSLKIFKQLTK